MHQPPNLWLKSAGAALAFVLSVGFARAGPQSPVKLYVAGEYARDTGDFRAATRLLTPALAAVPGDVVLRQRLFDASLQSGDIDTAFRLARQIVIDAPNDSQALLVLTVEAIRTRDWAEATRRLNTFSVAGLDGFLAPVLKSWVAFGSDAAGDPGLALAPLSSTPAYATFAAEQRAWLALAMKDWPVADAQFAKLVGPTGTANSVRIRLGAAAAAQRANNAAGARLALGTEPASTAHPWILRARQTLAAGEPLDVPIRTASDAVAETLRRIALDLAREDARTPAAGYAWLGARLSPGTPETLLTLAEVLTSAKQGATASTVLGGMPRDPLSQLVTALAQARVMQTIDRPDDAIALMKKTAENFPDRQDVWNLLGELYRIQENHAASIDAYTRALALAGGAKEDDWGLYFVRGMAYERLKNWTAAEADFKRALELKPDQPSVLNYLGYSWLERQHNVAEASRMIERAVAQRPTDGAMIDSLGWAYFLKGNYAEAVTKLEDALTAVPYDPTINEHLGDAYQATGRDLEALHRWQAALDGAPDTEQKSRLLLKLDRNWTGSPRAPSAS